MAVKHPDDFNESVVGDDAVVDDERRDRHGVDGLGGVPPVLVNLVAMGKQREGVDRVEKFLRDLGRILRGIALDEGADFNQALGGTRRNPDAIALAGTCAALSLFCR